ncbi:MAG TPA: potassium transporter Kup [Thermoanaerobaculia bacterium]|jgi:KUP system potassium uptake protein|nr:potassium transporter Kup [Thermoanaerobaculia bacterium]
MLGGGHAPIDSTGLRRRLLSLSLLALGIVYGDIGTSPLYALRECFYGEHAVALSRGNIFGVLSLIFWSLVVVVTVKYHVYVIRFDNRGEGGILALMGLVGMDKSRPVRLRAALIVMGVFGAALLYGDGMITPAISVLSAVEGLEVATPFFKPYVIPITIAILILLFMFQRRGTSGVGAVFGPIMLLWFGTLALLGIRGIVQHPSILLALNPVYAVRFFAANGMAGFLVLGAVFLVATGGEALYADLGHFGEKPIQIDWFSLVGPSLMLQYLGQGALLLVHPETAHNPFYLLAPKWALYPLVVLATIATVIASQAIISGVFSLTSQAIQLGYLPRMEIVHTSRAEMGQIYMPAVNWGVMLATIVLVLGFQSSSNLAGAYGVAVSTTMLITTLLAYVVARDRLHWSVLTAGLVTVGFLIADCAFFGANLFKIANGGWFPLVVAGAVFIIMTTWRRGREILNARLSEGTLTPELFVQSLRARPPIRVPGTAVFMHRNSNVVPSALLHSLKHYKALHENVILLSVVAEEVSHLRDDERMRVDALGDGIYRVVGRYGFMEERNVPELLATMGDRGPKVPPMDTTYFLGRETLIVTKRPSGMAMWRERIFAWMVRNAAGAARFFRLPPNRVVELGAQIEL